MSLGQPLWLLGLLLAVPIVVIYCLRGNARRRPTTTAFLWRGLGRQVTARSRWRLPPLSLGLLLQLLAVGALALALAHLAPLEPPGRQLVLLLDASASMQATDVEPSRFEEARRQFSEIVRSLGPNDRATLVRVGAQPTVLAAGSGTDHRELDRALSEVRPGAAPASLRDALALASRALEGPLAPGSEIVVATDGTLDVPSDLAPLSVPVRFVRVGSEGANRGISGLRVARAPGELGRLSAFAQVTNYGEAPRRAQVRLAADGLAVETRQLDLPARGRGEVWADLPPETRSVSAALLERDAFPLDDRAEVSVEENRRRSVLLVSRSPDAWERALGAVPGLDVTTRLPATYRDQGADLVLFDGFVPERLPGGQVILVNPPAGNPVVEVLGETRDNVRIASLQRDHPLLRSLDLGAVHLVKASVLAVPRWGTSVAESAQGPLIVQGELDGRRVLVYAFDPLLSGLEKLVVFPLMVANAVEFLNASGVEPFAVPGQQVALPVPPEAREISLELPSGSRQALMPKDGAARPEPLEQVGRHTLRYRLPSGEVAGRSFYVNLFGESEADVLPRTPVDWAGRGPLAGGPTRPGEELWLPLAILALGLLSLEWLHFVQRG